ncbi:hypothetical protein ILUMI_01808 [Ignelater luminosus]|uniref:CCD97-like C-terminal domain-containing protein n=1 Tax=Ignelater luminosus TaxID=2038154 RepID=A0A8K0GH23_IGNLU|nr:hypothetical protein ILUMI_01808 [Ignelater luminosus]
MEIEINENAASTESDHNLSTQENCKSSPINVINNDSLTEIIRKLADNDKILCKSQQRNEADITREEKMTILLDIFNKSKSSFLSRFGQFLSAEQAQYFEQFKDDPRDGYEVMCHLKNISKVDSKVKKHRYLRNKRYAALKRLEKDSYFSETEMMKRNPLLYEQLVGQYLSDREKRLRDRQNYNESKTFVGVLLDGIEKEQMEKKKREQEAEDAQMEESSEDSSSEEEMSTERDPCTSKSHHQKRPQKTLWGEIEEDGPKIVRFRPRDSDCFISAQERKILREEFVSIMYQNFLDGKDEEFDYNTVDNNEEYDNLEILEHDEEEKYFDSEEPEDMNMEGGEINKSEEESSEDELDIYMNALNQHPAVCQLSEHIKKL